MRRLLLTAVLTGCLYGQSDATSVDFFETKIRPVLANNCFGCHTNTAMGGLRLDSHDGMLKGGKRGAALVPGDPEKSRLIIAVTHTDEAMKMPMGNKLKDGEIANLAAWVKAGAVWPESGATPVMSADGKFVIRPEARNFWIAASS